MDTLVVMNDIMSEFCRFHQRSDQKEQKERSVGDSSALMACFHQSHSTNRQARIKFSATLLRHPLIPIFIGVCPSPVYSYCTPAFRPKAMKDNSREVCNETCL